MKQLHRGDLFGWSVFNEDRDIDFHSVLWVRNGGNVVVDPLPMNDHDKAHLDALGGAAIILITNSDHVRDSQALAEHTGARVMGPAGERGRFPMECAWWVGDWEEILPGLRAVALEGSKTPGELALILEESTLITGDLIRSHEGGKLCLLPNAKLADKARAYLSVQRLAEFGPFEAILPGDGWPVFRDGQNVLEDLLEYLEA
jgi:glyoxylase-like metal-dependent hydrolase (beta-lactamase superfamily II)